jgi:hormone-sensitive lipase
MNNAVICSIDYRLAPHSRFPDQIDDCWQAYYWLVINCKKAFGFEPKKIILVGDSAGGNLILALTIMSIERGFRKPNGIVPCYASTICTMEEFWPSLLFSVDDTILTQSFLNLCQMSYTPEGAENTFIGSSNKYLSPGLCCDEILK